ncbi:hypothetical protein NUW58_g2975 [Xylaria curta]|uniref:Uncharacterized protein n=1 Tax=Xylaria curta TaxID=42375 RepID=A0ACC1PEA2_9PEZI|nr:hypothetical protein NUW58_g2975 [Xylaria curta]
MSDVELIWDAAVKEYEQLTGGQLDWATRPKTLDELGDQITQTKSKFQYFRHSGSKLDKIMVKITETMNPIRKFIRALKSIDDKSLETLRKELKGKIEKMHNIVRNATASNTISLTVSHQALHADISKGIVISEHIRDNMNAFYQNAGQLMTKIDRREVTSERDETLKWLSSMSFHDKQRAIHEKRYENTGEWLLNSRKFQAWFTGNVNLTLWCPGIPGAGKTVMVSTVIAYVEEVTDRSQVAVAYMYCDYKEPMTEVDMLSTITRQLAEQCHPLPNEVTMFREKYLEKRTNPSNADRVSIINSMVRLFHRTFVFIDALDESPEENRELFLCLAKELSPFVRFFITSRPHLELVSTFPTLSRIDIMAKESDVRKYLKYRINRIRRLRDFTTQDRNLENEIIETIHKKADGMFLLAYLQITLLEKQTTVWNIRKVMETLPQGLYDFYRQAFDRIQEGGNEDKELAIKTLSFVFCARKTLTLDELLHALSVKPEHTELRADNCSTSQILLDVCKGLIWFDESIGTVGLVHYTLQEYFQNHLELLPGNPDALVAESCLRYLSFDIFESGPCSDGSVLEKRLQEYSFFRYASCHWGHHAERADSRGLGELIRRYLLDENRLASSTQVLYTNRTRVNGWHDRFPRRFSALHAAAYWGLSSVLEQLANDFDVDLQDSSCATAIHYAAQNGKTQAMSLLLKKGAARNRCNNKGQTPLALSAKSGYRCAVEALLDVGADALLEDFEGWTPLHWAIIGSHNDVVEALLNKSTTGYSQEQLNKALICAAETGNEDAVETLISRGADINYKDDQGSTPMDWATPEGREGVVRVLLRHGAKLNLTDNYNNSCLHWAISYPRIAKLLLENGCDANAKNNDALPPLHWSVNEGQIEATEILLKFGADVNYQDTEGVSALHAAALAEDEPIAKLLLQEGAQANLRDIHGWTPLHAAAVRRNQGLIDLLVMKTENGELIAQQIAARLTKPDDRSLAEHMAETKSRGSDVVSGLRNAANSGKAERILALLDDGADINAIDIIGGSTALSIATWLSFDDVVQLLIQQGADVNQRDRRGWTPLHIAARYGYRRIIELLVTNGADLDLKIHGWTPLLLTAKDLEPRLCCFLIDNGADVTAADYHGRTPLHWASKCGEGRLVRLLIKKGADVNAEDRWGRTPLIWAVHRERPEIVELLLHSGANVTTATREGYTPLHIAADTGNRSIIHQLLQSGADVTKSASDGLTAYDIAELMGFKRVKEQLAAKGAKKSTFRETWVPDTGHQCNTIDECWNLDFDDDGVAKTLRARLSDLLGPQDDPGPTNDHRWPGFDETQFDFSALFKPKKRHKLIGAPERSWKSYVESIEARATFDTTIDGTDRAAAGPSHSLRHRYIALSYAWGPVDNQRKILVNGIETYVRPNLYAALLELRKLPWVHRGIHLWTDALCINQDDLDERAQQVRIMRSIYATAWQVVVWLGPATESTYLAYTALLWLARAIGSGDKLKEFAAEHGIPHYAFDAAPIILDPYLLPWRDAVFSALRSFFACDYWHRLWILQELAMAKTDAPVLWGSYSMSLHEIWVACEAISESEGTVLANMATNGDDIDHHSSTLTVDRRLEQRHATPGQQWKHLIRIKRLRENMGRGFEFALPSLELARQAQASDHRDKVYGILGIPGVSQLAAMSPNYHDSLTQVYTKFTQEIILSNGLDIIRLTHTPVGPVMLSWFNVDNPLWIRRLANPRYKDVANACTHDLPSWVVCWTCKCPPLARLPRNYHAHNGLPSPNVNFSHNGALSLQAVFVDNIDNLSAFNILEADQSYPCNASSAQSIPNAYGDLAGLKEAFWRTIVADSTSTGDEPPSSWSLLMEQRRWSRYGTSEMIGSSINFGLHSFALRNLKLLLPGGHPLGNLLGYKGPHRAWGGNRQGDVLEHHSELDERDAVSWASNVLAWRRLIVTGTGRLGLTVAAALHGDKVAVLPGCSTPVVIRHVGAGWKLVGEIFVCGLMRGETAEMELPIRGPVHPSPAIAGPSYDIGTYTYSNPQHGLPVGNFPQRERAPTLYPSPELYSSYSGPATHAAGYHQRIAPLPRYDGFFHHSEEQIERPQYLGWEQASNENTFA